MGNIWGMARLAAVVSSVREGWTDGLTLDHRAKDQELACRLRGRRMLKVFLVG